MDAAGSPEEMLRERDERTGLIDIQRLLKWFMRFYERYPISNDCLTDYFVSQVALCMIAKIHGPQKTGYMKGLAFFVHGNCQALAASPYL